MLVSGKLSAECGHGASLGEQSFSMLKCRTNDCETMNVFVVNHCVLHVKFLSFLASSLVEKICWRRDDDLDGTESGSHVN